MVFPLGTSKLNTFVKINCNKNVNTMVEITKKKLKDTLATKLKIKAKIIPNKIIMEENIIDWKFLVNF